MKDVKIKLGDVTNDGAEVGRVGVLYVAKDHGHVHGLNSCRKYM